MPVGFSYVITVMLFYLFTILYIFFSLYHVLLCNNLYAFVCIVHDYDLYWIWACSLKQTYYYYYLCYRQRLLPVPGLHPVSADEASRVAGERVASSPLRRPLGSSLVLELVVSSSLRSSLWLTRFKSTQFQITRVNVWPWYRKVRIL